MTLRAERHDLPDRTEFRLLDVGDELIPAVRKSAFTASGGHWARSFPRDAPHLDRAWHNFQRLIEPWLRQAAGLDPVPWEDALTTVCRRLGDARADWWLTGSAALAVRGAPLTPGDLDLVVSGADATRVGDLLLDGLVEPVAAVDWFCESFGRAVLGARVEWVGGVGAVADDPEPTDFGPAAAARLETVRWRGWEIRVPPLDLQRAVTVRRNLARRAELIDGLSGADCRTPVPE
ncbi:hypothetical protein ACPCHT_11030 [Nucisporomicrobium flavum]|uniref:hypothetical protein n=1 Tax=Nucisporomicrobium flavum TaxID=2785915 RepID=UPI003C2F2E00